VAQSQVALYNLALSVIGDDFTVSAVDEESIQAAVCQLWYEPVRRMVLEAAHWRCARKWVRLVEEAERDTSADWVTTDPQPGYLYSYDIDDATITDFLIARHLNDYAEFEIGWDNDKRILSTNYGSDTASETPILFYTADVTDVTKWESSLYIAMAHALAGFICMGISGKAARQDRTLDIANDLISAARANTANEIHRRLQQRPEVLAARGYNYTVSSPYLYPYGSLLTATGAPIG